MKKEGLTAKQVEHIKPDLAKRIEVPAGPPTGLYLVVHPTARKSWAFRYRWHRQTKKLTFGKGYPEMKLAAARAEAEAALASLERGVDPAEAKAEEKHREPNSAPEVANEWLDRFVKPRTRTWPEVERILNKEVLPSWKKKLITEIGRADVLRLLDGMVDRGTPVLANRTLSILKRWFNWCLERGVVEVSPVAGIRPPASEKSRERVLSSDELMAVWHATDSLNFPFGPFLRFLILTAQRRGEVASMRWQDVDLDVALWTLPPEATKPGRIHDVPLSGPALEILKGLPRFEGAFVFSARKGEKPVSGFSKTKAALDKRLMDRRGKKAAGNLPGWTIHDLRRSAATWMAGSGVPPPVLAAILNHSPGSTMGVTQIYHRFRYVDERRAALESWGEYVAGLADSKRKLAAV